METNARKKQGREAFLWGVSSRASPRTLILTVVKYIQRLPLTCSFDFHGVSYPPSAIVQKQTILFLTHHQKVSSSLTYVTVPGRPPHSHGRILSPHVIMGRPSTGQ